jgi:hypothetical protein
MSTSKAAPPSPDEQKLIDELARDQIKKLGQVSVEGKDSHD